MTVALLEAFTSTPQLSKAERRKAMHEGEQFAKAAALPPAQRQRGTYSDKQLAFAGLSRAHMAIAVFMGGLTRDELGCLHSAMRQGTEARLEYPMPYVAKTLRSLNRNERREAWRLFGQGFIL